MAESQKIKCSGELHISSTPLTKQKLFNERNKMKRFRNHSLRPSLPQERQPSQDANLFSRFSQHTRRRRDRPLTREGAVLDASARVRPSTIGASQVRGKPDVEVTLKEVRPCRSRGENRRWSSRKMQRRRRLVDRLPVSLEATRKKTSEGKLSKKPNEGAEVQGKAREGPKQTSKKPIDNNKFNCLDVDVEGPTVGVMEEAVASARSCANRHHISRKVRMVARFLSREWRIKLVRKYRNKGVCCGGLRSAVRKMFPECLTEAQELSIKTSQKLEGKPCKNCEEKFKPWMEEWIQNRFKPQELDAGHLERFAEALGRNLPQGWNRETHAYIPNGHATLDSTRREGGNWQRGEFADYCRPEVVFSSGKPRIVTLYSEYNTSVLTPLHLSLYSVLQRKGWLLVGSPTEERLAELSVHREGVREVENKGDWLSFDYVGATDNIKTAYSQAAVDQLISKAEGLTDDQVRCLNVLSQLKLEVEEGFDQESAGIATRGQPMGSVMSFPLLCLINKTIVDMSLTDLLLDGKIHFKEWSGHRCSINGDDLLTRDTSSGGLFDRIVLNGAMVGMEVNKEKTMRHPQKGEINSTLFVDCVEEKKMNVAALQMKAEVSDVVGFAQQASTSIRSFRTCVRNNLKALSRQPKKLMGPISPAQRDVLVKDPAIKRALRSLPVTKVPEAPNLLPVVSKPVGYSLSREEEVATMNEEVQRLRRVHDFTRRAAELKAWKKQRKSKGDVKECSQRLCKALRWKDSVREEETILLCLARRWSEKVKEGARNEFPIDELAYCRVDRSSVTDDIIPGQLGVIVSLIKEGKACVRNPHARVPDPGGGDFVSLACTARVLRNQ